MENRRACIVRPCPYSEQVKEITAVLALTASLLSGGCSTDKPLGEEVTEHLQRGASGQGQLGPIDRSDDPFVTPRAGEAVPGEEPATGNP